MAFRIYISLMILGTCLSLGAWFLVVRNMNPDESGLTALSLFYLTLLMGFVGLFTCLGAWYRIFVRERRDLLGREVRISFRHAVFLSLLAVVALMLSAQGTLNWWTCLTLVASGGIIEYFFLMREESRRS